MGRQFTDIHTQTHTHTHLCLRNWSRASNVICTGRWKSNIDIIEKGFKKFHSFRYDSVLYRNGLSLITIRCRMFPTVLVIFQSMQCFGDWNCLRHRMYMEKRFLFSWTLQTSLVSTKNLILCPEIERALSKGSIWVKSFSFLGLMTEGIQDSETSYNLNIPKQVWNV
jgi:hypothetical protein